MATNTILIVEDNTAIKDMLCFSLTHAGFECHSVEGAESGLDYLPHDKPDLILVDWMLPGMDGIEFIRCLRANESWAKIPVIMLTAKGENEDMIKGLSVGADDYINKPFVPSILIARINALLRRSHLVEPIEHEKIAFAGITLDLESHRVTVDQQRIALGPTEFRLLHFFMKKPERVYSRGQLLDQVWGDTVYVEERTVDVHIRRLRQALEATAKDHLIQTVRGVGYRFAAD